MQYYKIIRKDLKHYNHTYQLGINRDELFFRPSGSCEPGGLYFTTKEHLPKYWNLGYYIADIDLLPNEPIYKDPQGDKWKTPAFSIRKLTPMTEHELFQDKEFCLKMLEYQPWFLPHMKQDYEIYLAAVKSSGCTLKFVPYDQQTDELKLEAVKNDPMALRYAFNPNLETCKIAVKKAASTILYTPEKYRAESASRQAQQNGCIKLMSDEDIKRFL